MEALEAMAMAMVITELLIMVIQLIQLIQLIMLIMLTMVGAIGIAWARIRARTRTAVTRKTREDAMSGIMRTA